MTDKREARHDPEVREEASDLESVSERLQEYGLTPNETKVFLQISRFGPMTASEIARSIGILRTEVYNMLSTLQNKGVIEASVDRPAKFSAMALENALSMLIDAERNRISIMEREKEELLKKWGSLQIPSLLEEKERLQSLKGAEQIYARFSEMLKRAKERVDVVAFGLDLARAYQLGMFRGLSGLHERKVRIQMVADISARTSEILSRLRKYVDAQQIKPLTLFTPHFVIVDVQELLMFTKSPGASAVSRREATALWTNSQTLVQTMEGLFNEIRRTPETLTGLVPLELRESDAANREQLILKKQIESSLSIIGFELKENIRIVGKSGAVHQFDLAAYKEGMKPMVIDLVFNKSEVTVIPIIKFFAKQIDVQLQVESASLVVKPTLAPNARELADSYKMRVIELPS